MFKSITSLFKELMEGNDLSRMSQDNPNLAMASLLCEVAAADAETTADETKAKQSLLAQLLDIPETEASALIAQANENIKQSVSLYDYTSQLRELDQASRYELIKAMWEIAHSDNYIDPLEDAVIRKVAELIYVDHSEFIRAKLSVLDK